MPVRYRFDRMEFAGSLGDLGTVLPLAIGMIMINGMSASGTFLAVGLYYILAGLYTGIPVPVEPMKVIGAYAIATAMSASQIQASGALMVVFLLIIGATGAVTLIGRSYPQVRGAGRAAFHRRPADVPGDQVHGRGFHLPGSPESGRTLPLPAAHRPASDRNRDRRDRRPADPSAAGQPEAAGRAPGGTGRSRRRPGPRQAAAI